MSRLSHKHILSLGLSFIGLAIIALIISWRTIHGEWCPDTVQSCAAIQKSLSEYRVKFLNTCASCNLSGIDFSSLDLTGVNLQDAELKDVNFEQTNLKGANLSGADLHAATASNAILVGANLSGADLDHAIFQGADFTNANLTNADIKEANLKNAVIKFTDLKKADLSRSNLTEAILVDVDLTGAKFERTFLGETIFQFSNNLTANFSDAILTSADLGGINLEGSIFLRANLKDVNLSEANLANSNLRRAFMEDAKLINTNFTNAELSEAYLYGADLTNANLENSTLVGAKFSGAKLNSTNMRRAHLDLEWPIDDGPITKPLFTINPAIEKSIDGLVTSMSPYQKEWLVTTAQGNVYETKGKNLIEVFDVGDVDHFVAGGESGLLSVASYGRYRYLCYTVKRSADSEQTEIVVNEYDNEWNLQRNIVEILFPSSWHHGGTLVFDKSGKLYLSTGDGEGRDPGNLSQDIGAPQGKIIRFDLSKEKPQPEIIAYGFRNPWKISIDTAGRMFVGDVGGIWQESVDLIPDLNSDVLPNYGSRVFEGSKRVTDDPLNFENTIAPIFEYEHHRSTGQPISVIGGFYIDAIAGYVLGDFAGNIRILKEVPDPIAGRTKWREVHFQKLSFMPTSFGYDGKQSLRIAGIDNTAPGKSFIFEIDLLENSTGVLGLLPWVTFCNTTMPDGTVRNDHCGD